MHTLYWEYCNKSVQISPSPVSCHSQPINCLIKHCVLRHCCTFVRSNR
ncbi:DUF2655 domain-containing protein [Xenorhabdus nematophila]|nr:DUF2655 domain-containing protein [Xenorhabdus nematophila]